MPTTRISRGDSKARTRADLIAAARSVFLRRGFHAATLDDIAEEAGYTKGAVYSNFAGKDDLFLALLAEHHAQRAEIYAALFLAEDDTEQTYRSIARFMFEAYEREPAWWPLVSDFATHASRQPELNERLRATREGFLDALAGTIETVCEQHGMTFVLPAREVARGTGALMRGMAVEWTIDPSPADAHAFEEMLAAFLRGLAVPPHEGSTG
jgi:AcrR family transcriptional regulator